MRTRVAFLLMLFAVTTAFQLSSQTTLPNGDFEQWTGNKPTGWDATNFVISVFNIQTVSQDTVLPVSGSSNVLIETKTFNLGLSQPTIPGVITLGTVNLDLTNFTGTVEGGIPFTGKPISLEGYIDAAPGIGDSAMIAIGFSKWNGTSRDTIGEGVAWYGTAHNEWVVFDIPVNFYGSQSPDSMNIIISSSAVANSVFVNGSKLRVDNIAFNYGGISVEQNFADNRFVLWADGGKTIHYEYSGDSRPALIEVFNLQGSLMKRAIHQSNASAGTVSLYDLNPGIYIIRLQTDDNNQFSRKIFLK